MQALRRASNVSEAVEVIGDLSSDSDSDSDSDGSPAFHDANESLPEGAASNAGRAAMECSLGCQSSTV
jgi:hypothetical protein